MDKISREDIEKIDRCIIASEEAIRYGSEREMLSVMLQSQQLILRLIKQFSLVN